MNKCSCGICKKCYDRVRYQKIKNYLWEFKCSLPNSLSLEQKEILIGGLLGDFYLFKNKHHVNSGISVIRSLKDREYAEYQFNIFKDFCSSPLKKTTTFDPRTNKNYYGIQFRTRLSPLFLEFRNKWYKNGVKEIPKDLKLSPLICAIWFCDDGCVIRLKNKKKKDSLRLILSTESFNKNDVLFLCSLLEHQLGGKYMISHKKNNQYYIRADNDTTVKFIKYIKSVFPQSMKRKSDKWKGLV